MAADVTEVALPAVRDRVAQWRGRGREDLAQTSLPSWAATLTFDVCVQAALSSTRQKRKVLCFRRTRYPHDSTCAHELTGHDGKQRITNSPLAMCCNGIFMLHSVESKLHVLGDNGELKPAGYRKVNTLAQYT